MNMKNEAACGLTVAPFKSTKRLTLFASHAQLKAKHAPFCSERASKAFPQRRRQICDGGGYFCEAKNTHEDMSASLVAVVA